MDVLSISLISALAAFAAIGLIVGLVKGFSKVKSWGVEYLLATVIAAALSGVIAEAFPDNAGIAGFIVIGVAVVCMLLFTVTSAILRKVFAKIKAKRKGGFGNFCNRVFGGVTLAVKGIVIAGVLSALLLTVLDFIQMEEVREFTGEIYASEYWAFFKPYIMDFFITGVLCAAIKCGYRSGLSSALWSLVVIALVVGAGYFSYHLAFNVEAFQGAAASLETTVIQVLGDMANTINGSETGITTLAIAQGILTAGLFLGMLVVIILLAIFVPKLINFARDGKVFFAIDGVLGAIVSCVLVLGVLMFVGGVLQTISDLEFMEIFTSYFEGSKIAAYFYTNNCLAALGVMPEIPLRDWLA